jgi:cytochrome c biogenesis protein CcmG/thiol:disulfide interchange protein DsbE
VTSEVSAREDRHAAPVMVIRAGPVVATVLLVAVAGCGTRGTGSSDAGASARAEQHGERCPAPGSPGVDGHNRVLAGLDLACLGAGAAVPLDRLGGSRTVLVNLWASWCGPCTRETARLQRLHVAVGDQVLFLGVDTLDSPGSARRLLTDADARYPQLSDPSGLVRGRLRAVGLPMTVLLAGSGRIVFRHVGELSAADLAAALARVGVSPRRAPPVPSPAVRPAQVRRGSRGPGRSPA